MTYLIDVATLAAILAIAVHGYMLIKGLGGMLSLGHAVFYGLGAYGSAVASTKFLPGGSFPLSLACGIATAALGATLIGWTALRERGRYFMIVTFAVQLIFVTIIINFSFAGGPDGISTVPRFALFSWQPRLRSTVDLGLFTLSYPQIKLAIVTFFAALSFVFCRMVIRSPFGRQVRAVREDELVAEAYGRDALKVKLAIFVIGAGVTGAAGCLFAHHFNYVGPTQFELDTAILLLVMLILGGQYNLIGATLGAVMMVALLEVLRFLLEDVFQVPFELTAHLRQVTFSAILLLVLAVRPAGLMPERLRRYTRPASDLSGISETVSDDDLARPSRQLGPMVPAGPRAYALSDRDYFGGLVPVLRARGLSKHFGGISALDGADLDLHQGRIVAIIGPNGAGKTTAFNVLSGFERPDHGDAFLHGQPIIGRTAAGIARLGMARTFQDVRIWQRLTVLENILASEPRPSGEHPLRVFVAPGAVAREEARNIERAWALLERFGLAAKANRAAAELSYAQRKMLALARITAFAPSVMLLDEPTSGVDPRRLDTFLAHIRAFAAEDGRAVCLIEHNMNVVEALADQVVFMESGKVLATGAPAEVLGDRALMRVYLGHREVEA